MHADGCLDPRELRKIRDFTKQVAIERYPRQFFSLLHVKKPWEKREESPALEDLLDIILRKVLERSFFRCSIRCVSVHLLSTLPS